MIFRRSSPTWQQCIVQENTETTAIVSSLIACACAATIQEREREREMMNEY